MKRGIPFRFQGKWMVTQTRTWSKFHNGRKANVGQQLGLKKINKLKKAEMSVSQSAIRVGKLITLTLTLTSTFIFWKEATISYKIFESNSNFHVK